MKKNLLLMVAAILTCGSMFISCSNDVDNPVIPTPDPVITGEWFTVVNRSDYSEYSDDDDVEYVLLTFDEDEQVLEIHNPADYMQSDYYWWEVDGNTLTLGKEENEKEVITTYHALTKADAALMAELEKKSNQ